MSTNNLYFEQKFEKYQSFLSENFHFLVVKCSVYLNKFVIVMKIAKGTEYSFPHLFRMITLLVTSHLHSCTQCPF